jgi:hypothetical protein
MSSARIDRCERHIVSPENCIVRISRTQKIASLRRASGAFQRRVTNQAIDEILKVMRSRGDEVME